MNENLRAAIHFHNMNPKTMFRIKELYGSM